MCDNLCTLIIHLVCVCVCARVRVCVRVCACVTAGIKCITHVHTCTHMYHFVTQLPAVISVPHTCHWTVPLSTSSHSLWETTADSYLDRELSQLVRDNSWLLPRQGTVTACERQQLTPTSTGNCHSLWETTADSYLDRELPQLVRDNSWLLPRQGTVTACERQQLTPTSTGNCHSLWETTADSYLDRELSQLVRDNSWLLPRQGTAGPGCTRLEHLQSTARNDPRPL